MVQQLMQHYAERPNIDLDCSGSQLSHSKEAAHCRPERYWETPEIGLLRCTILDRCVPTEPSHARTHKLMSVTD